MINNDIVAIASTSLVLYVLAAAVRDGFRARQCVALGAVLGAAYVARNTVVIVALVAAITLAWVATGAWRAASHRLLLIALPAILVGQYWKLDALWSIGLAGAFALVLLVWPYSWRLASQTFMHDRHAYHARR